MATRVIRCSCRRQWEENGWVLRIDNQVGVMNEGELDNLPDYLYPPVTLPEESDSQ